MKDWLYKLKQLGADLYANHNEPQAITIYEALKEIERLSLDSDRIDFLESMSVDIDGMKSPDATGRAVMFFAPYDGDRPPTLREAIDKAKAKHCA